MPHANNKVLRREATSASSAADDAPAAAAGADASLSAAAGEAPSAAADAPSAAAVARRDCGRGGGAGQACKGGGWMDFTPCSSIISSG